MNHDDTRMSPEWREFITRNSTRNVILWKAGKTVLSLFLEVKEWLIVLEAIYNYQKF